MIELIAGIIVAVGVFAVGFFAGLAFTARQFGRTVKVEMESGRLSRDEAARLAELRR